MGKLIDIRERLLDAADLVVDFATLGEYGIEAEMPRECEVRTPFRASSASLPGAAGLASGAHHPQHDRAGVPERLAA
jgi:hypothetical protein